MEVTWKNYVVLRSPRESTAFGQWLQAFRLSFSDSTLSVLRAAEHAPYLAISRGLRFENQPHWASEDRCA
jgi:hypothetical protein